MQQLLAFTGTVKIKFERTVKESTNPNIYGLIPANNTILIFNIDI